MKSLRHNILVCAVYIFLFSILIGYSFDFDLNKIIAGGDTWPYLNPSIPIEKSLYIWEESVLGKINYWAFVQISYASPLNLIYHVIYNDSIAQFIYWVFLYSAIPISFYLLSYYLTKNRLVSFFGGMLYSLNLYTAIIHHTPVYHMLYLHGVTPLLVLLLSKYYEQKKLVNSSAILFVIMYIPLLRIMNMYLLYFMILPVISYLLVKYYREFDISLQEFLKKIIIIFLFVLLLSAPYIPVLFVSYISQSAQTNSEYAEKSIAISKFHATLLNEIRFIETYGWEKIWHEYPGIQGFSAAEAYHTNLLLILLSFYPILLTAALALVLLHKATAKGHKLLVTSFLSMALLFLFLAKMINPPFGQINQFLYDHSMIFTILFRSAWKYMQIPYLLVVSLLVSVGLNEVYKRNLLRNKKQLAILVVILLLIHSLYISPAIVVYSKLINKAWVVEVPEYYYEAADFFNSQNESFRILPLPFSKHFTGYVPYTWGYAGPDLLYTLLKKPMIDKYHNMVLSPYPLRAVSTLENLSHTNLNDMITYARVLNVKYILVRGDINLSHPYIKIWYPPTVYLESLDSNKNVQRVTSFGNLTIYELKEYCPRIWISNTSTIFSERSASYLQITNNTTVILPIFKKFREISSMYLRIDFKLENKNVITDDWKVLNHQLFWSHILKVSVSPKGQLYIFFYLENTSPKYKAVILPLDKNDIKTKQSLIIMYQNKTLKIVKNGLVIYTENSSLPLSTNIKFVMLGGTLGAEKMIGEVYNITFAINNKTILTINDLISYSGENHIKRETFTTILPNCNSRDIIKYQKINPTLWKVKVNATKPFFLTFAESYDPLWEARVYKDGKLVEKVSPVPVYGVINGFWINQTGDLEIVLRYTPQDWFERGLIISLTTFILSILYLIYDWRREKGDRWAKRLEKKFRKIGDRVRDMLVKSF